MALNDKEIAWVEAAAGAVPRIDKALDLEARKQELLDQSRGTIDQSVGQIKVGEDFKVETLSEFLKRKVTIASIGDDPNEELDTAHDAPRMTGMDPTAFSQLMKAQTIIAVEVGKLRRAQNTETRQPLFTDREISDAIWAPLMRRKLIAENAIPDRYSEVSRTFGGASGEYDQRLAAYTDNLKDNDKAVQALGIAKDVIEAAGAVAGAVTADLAALEVVKNPAQVSAILKGVQASLSAAVTVPQAILKEGELNKKNIEGVVKDVVKSAQGLIGAAFSGASPAEQALGKAISAGVGIAINAPAVYVKVRDQKYADILDDLADTVSNCFSVYTSNLKYEGGKDTGTGTVTYAELGTIVSSAIKACTPALNAAMKQDASAATLAKVLAEAIKSAVNAGSTVKLDHAKTELETEASERDKQSGSGKTTNLDMAKGVIETEWQALRDAGSTASGFGSADKLIREILTKGPEALKTAKKDDPALKQLAELVKRQQAVVRDEELKSFDEEMAADEKQFRDLLNRSETGDAEQDVAGIEQLMMELKRDQMTVDLALELATVPAKAVAAFLPQAGIAVSAIELVKNLRKAAMHYKAFAEWQDNTRDARSAMSVQAEAMANRMDISRGKTTEAVVDVLENAASLVAGAVSVAGPFAPVGHVVGSTIGGVSALRKLITKLWRESELRDAWKLYVAARENPDDRKLVRASIRKNPTLAKYVLAWGAEVEQDRVAKAAMAKCGLNEETLSNKNSNVQKVVSFLETLYPDDPVLLQPIQRPEAWYPGPVEFSAASFAGFVGAAEKDAKPPLRTGDCRRLVTGFVQWQQLDTAYRAAQSDWQRALLAASTSPAPPDADKKLAEALCALQRALDQADRAGRMLRADLAGNKPVDAEGEPHTGMAAYLRALLPVARAIAEKYRRESEALAAQDGAIAWDPEAGLAA